MIIGMGSAGIVAAEFATTIGLRVAAVESDRIGGDCLWTGCVPSKALLVSGRVAHQMRVAEHYGLLSADPAIDHAAVWKRMHEVRDQIAATDDSPERFEQMGMALRNMFFPGRERADELVPWCTFTDPELAHAGLTADEARERYGAKHLAVRRIELTRSDRARTDRATDGALVFVTRRGRLVGAHVLAPTGGEMIHELAQAIQSRKRLRDLTSLVHVYPTFSTSTASLAAEAAFELAGRYRWLARLGLRLRPMRGESSARRRGSD